MADDTIRYLNTDLDLASASDLSALATFFSERGLYALHVTPVEEGLWHASFETEKQYEQPEPNIAAMVALIESLPESIQRLWRGCTRREFNIGYDCGSAPRVFEQGLSSAVLGRVAAAGASLRITLYAPERLGANRR